MSKMIGAAKFKAQCLDLIENVDKEGLVITKNGKPMAKLIPYNEDRDRYFGLMKNKIHIFGDIKTTGVKWNAES